MRTDSGIQGLTTAATVWVNAAVGVAAGGGQYHLAFIATGITLSALLVLQPIERLIARRFGHAPENVVEHRLPLAADLSRRAGLFERQRRPARFDPGRGDHRRRAGDRFRKTALEDRPHLSEERREIPIVVELAPLDGGLVGVEHGLGQREACINVSKMNSRGLAIGTTGFGTTRSVAR